MIEIHNLVKRFGDFEAVKSISLRVAEGELFCFLGPNGAGKTTTIKMMCGLLRPTSGRIVIGGHDLQGDGADVRRMTGYIPDTPYLYDLLTVTEFMQFTGDLYGLPRGQLRTETEELLSFFGLEEQRSHLIKDLSHGLRQRLVYASTFLQHPRIVFVDEPFVGLDPHSIRAIQDLLRRKVEAGMTIFLTTHILALAESMADRIGIIADGRLVAVGTLEEIKRQAEVEGGLEEVFLHLTE